MKQILIIISEDGFEASWKGNTDEEEYEILVWDEVRGVYTNDIAQKCPEGSNSLIDFPRDSSADGFVTDYLKEKGR